jgi:hypothetical protein
MKKIVSLFTVLLLLTATFAANESTTPGTKKKVCMEALYTQNDACGQTLNILVECCGDCNPGAGGNMQAAGLAWANANYGINPSGCFVARTLQVAP